MARKSATKQTASHSENDKDQNKLFAVYTNMGKHHVYSKTPDEARIMVTRRDPKYRVRKIKLVKEPNNV